jgi:hypothetical protein
MGDEPRAQITARERWEERRSFHVQDAMAHIRESGSRKAETVENEARTRTWLLVIWKTGFGNVNMISRPTDR